MPRRSRHSGRTSGSCRARASSNCSGPSRRATRREEPSPSRTRSRGPCTRTTTSWARTPSTSWRKHRSACVTVSSPAPARSGPPFGGWRRIRSPWRRFFATHPAVAPVPAYDTAGSVRDLMAGRVAADAAIASSLAAELYGAVVLEQDLEDHAENYTRFLMVARDPAPPELARKTSLVFTLPNAPGSLHRALGVFAARGLDLTKIESRPLPGRPWEYAFYLDVVGDPRAGVGEALAELRALARELRILGAYPGSDIPVAKG